MKERFFAYLARQLAATLRAELEPLIRSEAERIVAALQAQLRDEATAAPARPARRFIGQ